MCGGDFNEIGFMRERKGEMLVDMFMGVFSEFIDGCGMIDLPLSRSEFTWAPHSLQGDQYT